MVTQILGGSISEVPLWAALPSTTLYKIIMKIKKSRETKKENKKGITYTSQKEAEIEWLKQTQSIDTLHDIDFNLI